MRKFLLISTLAVAMTANAADYGTSPETAVDFPAAGWPVDMATAPAEAWFKVKVKTTNGRPAMYPSVTVSTFDYKIYICPETLEAPLYSPGVYALESDKEYLMKVTPKASGADFLMSTEFPASFEGREFFPIEVKDGEFGLTRSVEPGKTQWYKITAPYPSNVTTNYMMMPVMDVEKIVVKHQECPGGVNEGSAIMPAYNKAGVNVIGITASAAATDNVKFQLGFNALATLNCNNNLSRSAKMNLEAEETYPDAYYTVERVFEAPEDGEYTFINHGAKGTELNIGAIVRGDADSSPFGNKLSCDFSNGETAVVGDKDAMIVKTLAKGDLVAVQSDAFTTLGEGTPYLKVVKGNATGGINNVANDNNSIEIKALGGKSFAISNVLLAGGANASVYDMNARKVSEIAIPAGAESQTVTLDVPSGIYLIVVYGSNRSASAKVIVE